MRTLSLVLVAILLPSAVFSAPQATLSWDSCSLGPVNQFKTYAGPGVYHQVVIGNFFDTPVKAHQVRVRLTSSNVFGGGGSTPVPDAWRFDTGGCEAGRATAVPDHSEAGCPALAPPGTTGSITSQLLGNDVLLIYDCNYALMDPDPATNYVLFRIDFDLSSAFPGPQSPPLCGGADQQVCFVMDGGTWTDAAGVVHDLGFAFFQGVAWQDQPPLGCFGDLPTEPATWGKLRALYR